MLIQPAALARRFGTVFAGLMLFLATPALAQTTVTFNYTGAQQTWVVPAGVTSVNVVAEGAQGYDSGATLGGRGGRATGTLAVTPGQTLYVYVGGQGLVTTGINVPMGGGFNGGGHGLNNGGGPGVAGGGGGASDVRQGGFALTDRKIVGGGGGGSTGNGTPGGAGGGLIGGNGAACCGAIVGQGGTQAAGGTLGGGFGQGGNATVGLTPWLGGGGGGWYGGGTSDAHSGGGGGSSYFGGAGVTGGATTGGLRVGDGLVTFTYTAGPAPVPTMSEWAMILFALMLAGGAAMMIQRRRLA